jgi:RNA polymerase sigma-70 factor, ECF subfamily
MAFKRNRGSDVCEGMSSEPAAILMPIQAAVEERSERLASLFDAHDDRLYRLARRLTATAEDARDLVHDTFLRAAGAMGSVPHGFAKEEAWLVRVLVNIRRDQWRRAAVRLRSATALRESLTAHPSSPEDAFIRKRIVWAALDQLEPRRRAIVVMHELEGMRREAISSLLGVSTVTVRWHLSMGRRDLKRILEPQLGHTI